MLKPGFARRMRGASALSLSLAVVLPAATARADLHCGESFEGSAMSLESRTGTMVNLMSCGTWTNPSSEWSTDTTSFPGNKALRRNDANSPGIWSVSRTGNTYGSGGDPNITMTADVMVDPWNSTHPGQQAAVLGRVDINTGNWYGATVGYDGWLHLKKQNAGTVSTFSYVDPTLGRDMAAFNINAQKGVFYTIRIEMQNIYTNYVVSAVRITAYVDNALAATFLDDGSVAGPVFDNGAPGVASKGCKAVWDNVIIGNGNDDGGFDDATRYEESGESASLMPAPGAPMSVSHALACVSASARASVL